MRDPVEVEAQADRRAWFETHDSLADRAADEADREPVHLGAAIDGFLADFAANVEREADRFERRRSPNLWPR